VTADRYWCEHAWLGGDDVADGVVLGVEGGEIAAVTPGVAGPPAGATRLDGLTLPGLANAHSHAFHRALRGRTHRGGGTFWTWRDTMYELAAELDPDRFEQLATATFGEMVLSGYTCVGEFHYVHHGSGGGRYADGNELGRRVVAAAERAGIRITLLDACYLNGGIGAEPAGVQARFTDGTAERWIERVAELDGSATSRIGAAVHSVRAVDPGAIEVVASWVAARGMVLHAHVSEQPQENTECLAAYGATPVGVLDRAGALGPAFTAVHATHVDAGDIERLAASRTRCCICPTTERELADGIGPTGALAERGLALCIGSDSQAVIDPFEEARAVELGQRVASLRRGTHSPADLLIAATAAGYESLGWHGGALAAGAPADFVRVAVDGVRLAGSDRGADLLAAVVFAATSADVRDVVVAGERIVADGEHQRFDVAAALERSVTAAWAAS
jgi:formiminoglutamate deiminase